ncbi:hypothetical protein [Ktedonospora formicarum]|uniref:Uncharacterized protein n=1 Tax=Ktedonospora formicarum TaxID=2778364 RepID=A0A8J3I7I8_9CHLR|nr:hypothetical protein [Ktedonospora formicarum]GHO46849.1 hypothetical protein KSX_50120 [Ktedonospora formicarum]
MQQPPPPPHSTPNPYQSQPYQENGPNPAQSGFPYQPASPAPRSTNSIALTYGLIFGAIMVATYILSIVVNQLFISLFIHRIANNALTPFALLQGTIFMIIYWVLYFVMGMLAAQRARKIATATIAGLWASLLFFIAYCVGTMISFIAILRIAYSSGYFISVVLGLLVTLFLHIGVGIGIGALGGLVGKGMGNKTVQMGPPSAYPPM